MVFFQTHVNGDDLESGDTPPKPELAGNHHGDVGDTSSNGCFFDCHVGFQWCISDVPNGTGHFAVMR